jgi:hypothetical protein
MCRGRAGRGECELAPSKVFGQPVFADDTLFVATETSGLYDFAP